MNETLTVRLSKGMKVKLLAISRTDHIPVSDLVRQSIEGLIALRQFRRLRSQVLPYAEAQGLFTDEDIFRKVS